MQAGKCTESVDTSLCYPTGKAASLNFALWILGFFDATMLLTGSAFVQALDGGYLALLLAEAVRGKKLPAGVEQGIVASGFLLITAVGLLLVLRDTLNLTLGSTGL